MTLEFKPRLHWRIGNNDKGWTACVVVPPLRFGKPSVIAWRCSHVDGSVRGVWFVLFHLIYVEVCWR